MKKPSKKTIAEIVTRAEIRRVFADAAKQNGKKSAFLMIRHQETGRPE